ncbi:MAG: VOC family protein [Kordiimonadaceae bacterium]|nr:VOC family protein [Kordiimonadaceae bacterium]
MLNIRLIKLLVSDYDEAIDYYTNSLGMLLTENIENKDGSRWVTLSTSKDTVPMISLAKATSEADLAAVGKQAGDHVYLILQTDNFERDHTAYKANGVEFLEEPRHEQYGTVAIFKDIYGNKWGLIEPK